MIVLAYIAMLIFDFVVICLSAYVYTERGYSGWWVVLAILLTSISAPRIYGISNEKK